MGPYRLAFSAQENFIVFLGYIKPDSQKKFPPSALQQKELQLKLRNRSGEIKISKVINYSHNGLKENSISSGIFG